MVTNRVSTLVIGTISPIGTAVIEANAQYKERKKYDHDLLFKFCEEIQRSIIFFFKDNK